MKSTTTEKMNKKTSETELKNLAIEIKIIAKKLGFNQVGITDTNLHNHEQYLNTWLKKGYQGEMHYMKKHGTKRSHPEELIEGTQTVISLSMDYLHEDYKGEELLKNKDKAFISGYALGRDYHKVMKKKLQKLVDIIKIKIPAQGRVFVDSGPVLEKALAEKSGLGWIGKNTLLLNKKRGSFFFLGEIYTNLNLPLDKVDEKNHCGSCKACIDICPTKAIVGPKKLDARKCISYLTIEYKGSIEEELRPMMGNRIFGCDDCQLVCPWNKFAQFTQEEDFKPRHNLNNSGLSELFKWTEENYLKKTKGSPIRRAGYESWSRNIAVALGNADTSKEVYESLMSRRNDPSAIVREHVKWALDQHKGKSS